MNQTTRIQKIALIVFGLFVTLLLLEGILRLGGSVYLYLQERRNQQSLASKGEYRILCLGESTTSKQWPPLLEEILNERDIGIRFSVIDKGIPTTNSAAIVAHVPGYIEKYSPHLVIAMMGINDKENVFYAPQKKGIKDLRTYTLMKLLQAAIVEKGREIYACFNRKKTGAVTVAATDRQSSSQKAEYPVLKEAQPAVAAQRAPAEGHQPTEADETTGEFWNYIELGDTHKAQRRYTDALSAFLKAIELDPESEHGYIRVGLYYRDRKIFDQAELFFKKAIALAPTNSEAYLQCGYSYSAEAKYAEAETMFKRSIALNPGDKHAYIGLGNCYKFQGNTDARETLFRDAIAANKDHAWGYAELAWVYRDRGEDDKAITLLEEAMQVDAHDAWPYIYLGWMYKDQRAYTVAEELLVKAIAKDPNEITAYSLLAELYRLQGRFAEAAVMLEEALTIDPHNEEITYFLELCKTNTYAALRGDDPRPVFGFYSPATLHNYRILQRMVRQKNIPLVCVQYPLRDVGALKRIFKEPQDIVFVDNEKIFNEAVKESSYEDYFVDRFAEDFGHCTKLGNRLLAENIAESVLAAYFERDRGSEVRGL
jgi:tetratricopeptide (TPR) repeat protein